MKYQKPSYFRDPIWGSWVSLWWDMSPYRHEIIGSKIVCRPTILEDLKYSGYCGDCLWSDGLCPRHSRKRLTNFAVATFLIFSILLGIFTVLSCCEVIWVTFSDFYKTFAGRSEIIHRLIGTTALDESRWVIYESIIIIIFFFFFFFFCHVLSSLSLEDVGSCK